MVHIWSRYKFTSMIKNQYIYIYIYILYIYIFDMIWKCGFYFYIFHSICPVLSLSLYWLSRLYLIKYVSKFQYLNNLYININNLVLSQTHIGSLKIHYSFVQIVLHFLNLQHKSVVRYFCLSNYQQKLLVFISLNIFFLIWEICGFPKKSLDLMSNKFDNYEKDHKGK